MADERVGPNAGTFAKLIPKSRSIHFQLLSEPPNRKIPDDYPSSTSTANQTSESSEPTNSGDLIDEMRAIESSYIARIGDQGLPSSAREMYRLVADMAAKAVSSSDKHPIPSVEAVNAVRCIDRYVRETTSELNTVRRDLSSRTDDNRLFRFHAELGDYAGAMCTLLKDFRGPSLIRSQPWTIVIDTIDKEEADLAAWTASDQSSSRPHCLYLEALKARVAQLIREGQTTLDLDLALFAIRSYARRNFICHSKVFDLVSSNDFAKLAEHIELDDKFLEDILPDEEKPQVDNYRRLLNFYRDKHIRKDGEGKWVKQAPHNAVAGLVNPSLRPWGQNFVAASRWAFADPPDRVVLRQLTCPFLRLHSDDSRIPSGMVPSVLQ